MSLYPTATVLKSGLSASTSNVRERRNDNEFASIHTSVPSVLVAPSPAAPGTSLTAALDPATRLLGTKGAVASHNRALVYDSFVTMKNSLRSPQMGAQNHLAIADTVNRSRSFVINRDKLSRSRSDDLADLDDQPDDESTASVTDVRVHIQRENSLCSFGKISPRMTQPRTPTGSISYVAWEDPDLGAPAGSRPQYPPLKMWTEDGLIQFGHTAYHDENLSQITDYLYIGDIYAANNEHLLCRLSIDAIVDMSNLRPEDVRKLKACHIPCTCPMSINHQRARLILGTRNSDSEDIHLYFDEINRFIENIRRSGRKVLVHSVRGQGRAAVAIIQYFMQVHHLPMQAAFRVAKLARVLKINPGFRETLEFLENQLRREGKLPPAQVKNRLAPRMVLQP